MDSHGGVAVRYHSREARSATREKLVDYQGQMRVEVVDVGVRSWVRSKRKLDALRVKCLESNIESNTSSCLITTSAGVFDQSLPLF